MNKLHLVFAMLLLLPRTNLFAAEEPQDEVRRLRGEVTMLRASLKNLAAKNEELAKRNAKLQKQIEAFGEQVKKFQHPLPPTPPKTYESVQAILLDIPERLYPPKGKEWDELTYPFAHKWVQENVVGRSLFATATYDKATGQPRAGSVDVHLKKKVTCRHIAYVVSIEATYDQESLPQIAKLARGAKVNVQGKITAIRRPRPWPGYYPTPMELRITLDCRKPALPVRPEAPHSKPRGKDTQAPQPAPKKDPAKKVKTYSIGAILSQIPQSIRPAGGKQWDQLTYPAANKWFSKNVEGRNLQVTGRYCKSSFSSYTDKIHVSLSVPKFTYRGRKYDESYVEASFDKTWLPRIKKLHSSREKHTQYLDPMGRAKTRTIKIAASKVTVRGEITRIELDLSFFERMPRLRISLSGCTIR